MLGSCCWMVPMHVSYCSAASVTWKIVSYARLEPQAELLSDVEKPQCLSSPVDQLAQLFWGRG